MNNTQENYYRVIKPYESNLVHVSSTLMGGAAKCYKECKKVSPQSSAFSVMHMKTKQTYDFNINNTQMMGGANETQVCTNNDIRNLQVQIDSLINRVKTLEDKLSLVNNPEKTQQEQDKATLTNTQQNTQQNTQPIPQLAQLSQLPQNQSSQLNMNGGSHNNFNVNLAKRFI
jgi:hypothetical protein